MKHFEQKFNKNKNFREIKEIISKAVFEALKIHSSHFCLINKLFRKQLNPLKPRKFLSIFKVKKVNQAYHEKSNS